MNRKQSKIPSEWLREAEATVREVLDGLPEELRDRAVRVPVVYEALPSRGMVKDGVEPDTLGLFVGEAFPEQGESLDPSPAEVLLFLENIYDLAEGDRDVFHDEVRDTYLHELGHYLGLDEEGVAAKGLE